MSQKNRIYSIDILRGFVMILMALDHARGYFIPTNSPTDAATSMPWIYFTRWITHLCAPAFILLAGMSIYFSSMKKTSTKTTSVFLIKRGIWLILLEVTLMTFFWRTHFDVIHLQILWVIGISFVLMSLLIYLPAWVNLIIAPTLIIFHNILDQFNFNYASNSVRLLMTFLHTPDSFYLTNAVQIDILYTIIPWAAIMILGYSMAGIYTMPSKKRKYILFLSGALMLLTFIILRSANLYGDPMKWSIQNRGIVYSIMSFLDVTKYPASLQFILLTLGISFILLATLDNVTENKLRNIRLLGQTALFFYIIHIPFIRLLAKVYYSVFTNKPSAVLFYVIWLLIVFVLYLACRIYINYKIQRKNRKGFWWLSYI